jgi:hypothetical protein
MAKVNVISYECSLNESFFASSRYSVSQMAEPTSLRCEDQLLTPETLEVLSD